MQPDVTYSPDQKHERFATVVHMRCAKCGTLSSMLLEPGDPATGHQLAALEKRYFDALTMLDAMIDSMAPLEQGSPFARAAKQRLKIIHEFMMKGL